MVHEVEHDCSVLNTDHTGVKVTARLCLSLFLFAFAYAMDANITRGTTRLNGSQAHCGGTCQSAHAALTPTLCDDMLLQIGQKLGEGSFQSLDLIHQKYLKKRFKLTDEDIKNLSSDDKTIRSAHLEKIISRLTMHEKWGTYIQTPTDFSRNVTYDNHASSNRVDMYLEKRLRKKEEQLAKRCTTNEIKPMQALEELQTKYRKLIDKAIVALHSKKEALQTLREKHNELMKSDMTSEDLITKVNAYLASFSAFFEKKKGAPNFKSFKQELTYQPSQNVLNVVAKIRQIDPLSLKKQLVPLENIEIKFQEAEEEIDRRLIEAKRQELVLHQTAEEIKTMFKSLFPVRNDDGDLVTPSKDHLQQHMIDLIVPTTPTRSDRKKY